MSSKIKIHFVDFDDSNIRSSQIFFISYANLLSFVLFSMANVFHSKNSRVETKARVKLYFHSCVTPLTKGRGNVTGDCYPKRANVL